MELGPGPKLNETGSKYILCKFLLCPKYHIGAIKVQVETIVWLRHDFDSTTIAIEISPYNEEKYTCSGFTALSQTWVLISLLFLETKIVISTNEFVYVVYFP